MTAEEKLKKEILKYIDNMEIDVEDLDSYSYSSPSYSWVSSNPEPASEEWDEDEEYQAKIEWLINAVEKHHDHLGEYVDMTDEEADDEELQLRLLNWLKYLKD